MDVMSEDKYSQARSFTSPMEKDKWRRSRHPRLDKSERSELPDWGERFESKRRSHLSEEKEESRSRLNKRRHEDRSGDGGLLSPQESEVSSHRRRRTLRD
jgi:hypothetical protein